jgi:hypothetical protein
MGTHVNLTNLGLDAEHTILQLVNNVHTMVGALPLAPASRVVGRRLAARPCSARSKRKFRDLHRPRHGNRCTRRSTSQRLSLAAPSLSTPAPSRAPTAIPTQQPPPAHRGCRTPPSSILTAAAAVAGEDEAKKQRPAAQRPFPSPWLLYAPSLFLGAGAA